MITRRLMLAAAGSALSGRAVRADAPRGTDLSFIIPYASGGGFDAYVRIVIPALQKALNARVLPDNEDGAGGARAVNLLFRARPDGSTISVINIPGAFILQQTGGLGLDLGQLTWLCNMGRDVYGMMVPADSPLRTVDDMRALGRRRPVKFTCVGPAGTGYAATRIGAKLLDIPARVIAGYKGTNDYVVAALRGDGDAAVAALPGLTQFLQSGLIRLLATFETKGSIPGVPDATALGVPDLADIAQFRPVAGPPDLPGPVAGKLSAAIISALGDPSVRDWARRNHANLQPDDADETRRILMQQDRFIARWKDYLTA